jgi:hypothetical protein
MSDVMSRDDKGRHYGMQNDRKNWGKMGGFVTLNILTDALSDIAAIKEICSICQWSYEANHAIKFTIMGIPRDLHITADDIPNMLRHQEYPTITTMPVSTL